MIDGVIRSFAITWNNIFCLAYLSAAAKGIQTRIEGNVGATSGTTEDEMFLIDSVVVLAARHVSLTSAVYVELLFFVWIDCQE